MPKRVFFACACTSLLLCGCDDSAAVDDNRVEGSATTAAATSETPSPTAAALSASADGSLLTLSGKVVATAPAWFRVEAGDEIVTVEMDDWDWYQEGRALKPGDEVTVTGRVDKGLWEQNKIEASSVFVRNLGVSFMASGVDEEERTAALVQVGTATTSALGLVSNVEGQEFTVGSMRGPVRVDMSQLKTKPALKIGDRVYTWGSLDVDPVEGVEMKAYGLSLLSGDRTKQDQTAAAPGAGNGNEVS